MAVVKGVKEKVHLPLYDSITVRPTEQLGKTQNLNTLRFFQDITLKNKLQTNMQAASLLPHWNTFEARAMRVIISDLVPVFPETPTVSLEFSVTKTGATVPRTVNLSFSLRHFVDFKRRVEGTGGAIVELSDQDELVALGLKLTAPDDPQELQEGEVLKIDLAVLKDAENKFEQLANRMVPPLEQVFPNNGFGNLIGKLIYNSVTTFYVGEKIMIQVPTWFFPSGAGPCANGNVTTHGEASPEATFRFAEPIRIDAQQNFRVEIEVPDNEVMSSLQKLYGPFVIWVLIDGYMTRDVQ